MTGPLSKVISDAQQAAAAIAPLGWAFYGHWHRDETTRILGLLRRGGDRAEIDAEITRVWNEQQPTLLRHVATPLGRYGRGIDLEFQRRCQQRATLINEAVKCHEEERYAAAIPLTLTQIDGLTREIVGTTFFKAAPGSNEPTYTDDDTLAGVEGNLPIVRSAFSEPVDKVGRYGLVSRHGVIHGHDLSYATKANSTKTLVLVGALVEHLESRAEGRARRWRRDRDLEKSRLNGTDETGRLLDDRGLEELYMFRAEFEGRVFNDIRQGSISRSSLEIQAYSLLEQWQLSRRNFSLVIVEANRVMWHFLSPGGRHLGSALHIPDHVSLPVVTRHWTWDGPSAPRTLPWENEDGWTSTEDDPRTVNWTFRGFFNG